MRCYQDTMLQAIAEPFVQPLLPRTPRSRSGTRVAAWSCTVSGRLKRSALHSVYGSLVSSTSSRENSVVSPAPRPTSTTSSSTVYIASDIRHKRTRLLPPRSGSYHVYCSAHNAGALELMAELKEERQLHDLKARAQRGTDRALASST